MIGLLFIWIVGLVHRKFELNSRRREGMRAGAFIRFFDHGREVSFQPVVDGDGGRCIREFGGEVRGQAQYPQGKILVAQVEGLYGTEVAVADGSHSSEAIRLRQTEIVRLPGIALRWGIL